MQSLMTTGHAFESAWSETLISYVFSLLLMCENIDPEAKNQFGEGTQWYIPKSIMKRLDEYQKTPYAKKERII